MSWRPDVRQFATSIKLQTRKETVVNGAPFISYADINPASDFCSWKSRGGSESVDGGTLVVQDTAEVVMWYRPDVTERDRVLLNGDSSLAYEILNVENVEMRNQFMILKVARTVTA